MNETSQRPNLWVESVFKSRFLRYVGEEGTEIGDRRCLVDYDKRCDLKCSHALITWSNNEFTVLCSRFTPAINMGKRTV